MSEQFTIEWIDREREPKCAPDPNFPSGKDVVTPGDGKSCYVELPYPAKRCGIYVVECGRCKIRVGITTAGRADDPKSCTIKCKEVIQ
jgi:hypothetical protein